MAPLQEAFQCLAPTSWDSVPATPNELRDYINDIITKARLIIDSVPEPPPPSDDHYHFESKCPASRITPSSARIGPTNPEIASLQQQWGKPMKINSNRDNPLEIPVYKTHGGDGKGHWFSRRTVHEGLSFTQWKKKLSSEMHETLVANQKQVRKGKVADQAVRGIGAEQLVEQLEVKDVDGKTVLGHVNVYHVSAQFPKPTTPRDFVTLIIDWETEVNKTGGSEDVSDAENPSSEAWKRGRNWMMISKPCEHPDVSQNHGYIRGQYESIEFIREILVKKAPVKDMSSKKSDTSAESTGGQDKSDGKKGRKEGQTVSVAPQKREAKQDGLADDGGHDEGNDEESPYPVEWIMVTRSDPGGSIPRWVVEKGTPKSICTDTVKFLDWACRGTDLSGKPERPFDEQENHSLISGEPQLTGAESVTSDESDLEYEEEEHHGLIASFTYLLNTGLERYAPQAVRDFLPNRSRQPSSFRDSRSKNPGEKDLSAAPNPIIANSPIKRGILNGDVTSETSLPVSTINSGSNPQLLEDGQGNIPPAENMKTNKKAKLSSHEKQLAKLVEQKKEVQAQLDNVRNEIQALHLNSLEMESKREMAADAATDDHGSEQLSSGADSSVQKLGADGGSSSNSRHHHHPKSKVNHESAKLHQVASGLFHDESKLLKRLGKIEKYELKEASKVEARQRKDAGREEKSRSRTEADALRREVEMLKKEIDRLRKERGKWLDLVGSLQAENARLAACQANGKNESGKAI